MEWWKLIYWAIGFFGIAGTIILMVFAPTAIPLIIKAIVKFFTLVLSYRIGCALVAAVLAALIADYVRHSHDDAVFAQRVAEFEQKQRDRDTRIATETEAEVRKEIAEATTNNVIIDQDVKGFHDALPPIPTTGNPFLVGDASCRLRQIAGYAGCGPDRAQGVPKARSEGVGTGRIDWSKLRLPGFVTGSSGSAAKGQ